MYNLTLSESTFVVSSTESPSASLEELFSSTLSSITTIFTPPTSVEELGHVLDENLT